MYAWDKDDITSHIRDHIENVFHTQKSAAKAYGVSASYLNDVLEGRRRPGKKILDALGFKAVTYYERKDV